MFRFSKDKKLPDVRKATVKKAAPVPDDEEPDEWKQYPDEKHVLAWYRLEGLTKGGSPMPPPESGGRFYLDEAGKGNRCAQYALGRMYLTGTLVSQNSFQTGLWFSKAAEQESPLARFELAKMLSLGIGLKQDMDSARSMYRNAYQPLLTIENRFPNPAVERMLAAICRSGAVPDAGWKQPGDHCGENRSSKAAERKPEGLSVMHTDCIPAKYIHPAKDNQYAQQDTDESIHTLALSIQVHGLINPLTLRRISDTEYQIIAGEKRFKAITHYLHWNAIPAVIKDKLSDNDAQPMLHAANLSRLKKEN